jgi:integrase
MSRIFYYAEGHGLWEEGKRSPASKAKLGKKHHKYERRMLSFDETARVLARLEEPNLLVIETCIATGARISEVLGLKLEARQPRRRHDQDRAACLAPGRRPPQESR